MNKFTVYVIFWALSFSNILKLWYNKSLIKAWNYGTIKWCLIFKLLAILVIIRKNGTYLIKLLSIFPWWCCWLAKAWNLNVSQYSFRPHLNFSITCIIYSLQLSCHIVSLTVLIQASKGIDLVSIFNNAVEQNFLVWLPQCFQLVSRNYFIIISFDKYIGNK